MSNNRSIAYEVITWHRRYNYRLTRTLRHQLRHFEPGAGVVRLRMDGRTWITLDCRTGDLHIHIWYCWDGASGPAVDTVSMHRASCVHDALYQMIADGLLPTKPWKRHADNELFRVAREDGVPWWRASWAWAAVRIFGGARDRFNPDGLRSH